MQLFTSDDRATNIGDAIGMIIAAAIYVGLFGIIAYSIYLR
jgi:hypothetical protein